MFTNVIPPDFRRGVHTYINRHTPLFGPFHRLFSPHVSLSAPSKGHQNPNLPALNKQWQRAGGRSASTKEHKNINSSYSKHATPLFYSMERTVAADLYEPSRATATYHVYLPAVGTFCIFMERPAAASSVCAAIFAACRLDNI